MTKRISVEQMPEVKNEEQMRHLVRYVNFINSRPERDLIKDGKFFNIHHIIPRSLNGLNEESNLIKLAHREHFIAHLILWKCGYREMASSFHFMVHNNRFDNRITSKSYETLKVDYSNSLTFKFSGENNPMFGKNAYEFKTEEEMKIVGEKISYALTNRTPQQKKERREKVKKYWENMPESVKKERKEKLSEKFSGENNPRYGRSPYEKMSDEQKNQVIEKTKNTWRKMSQSKKDEITEKRLKTLDERTQEQKLKTKEKKSLSNSGEKNPFYGKHHSEETIKKIREKKKSFLKEKKEEIRLKTLKTLENKSEEEKLILFERRSKAHKGKTHCGKIVKCLNDGEMFNSLKEVGQKYKISYSKMKKFGKNKFFEFDGFQFEIIQNNY